MLGRRDLLAGLGAATLLGRAQTASALPDRRARLGADLDGLEVHEIKESGRLFLLAVPRGLRPPSRVPLLVLLHGLGETGDEQMGAWAWLERYGLGSAWQRLAHAPVARTSKRGEWSDERLSEVNAELAARPFRGLAMVCPFMPKLSAREVPAYASWLERVVARARAAVPILSTEVESTYLCGCSLGAYVSLEVMARAPHVFGAWGGVQTAIGAWAAPGYAKRLSKAFGGKARPLFVETSSLDHYRTSSEALHAAFVSEGMPATKRVSTGPHDQPWLREVGTLEALLWFDRLSYARAARAADAGR
jgi:predicted esterase